MHLHASSRRWWTAVLVAAGFTGACEGKPQRPPPTQTAPDRTPAPPLRAATVDGEAFDLADMRGQVVLLNIWATWCGPCRAEMPELEALHRRFRDQGFSVVGVSVDAARLAGAVRQMVDEFELTYPNVHDAANEIGRTAKVVGYPTSFLIDRTGAVAWRRDGMIEPNDPELARVLASLLAEPG